MHIIIIILIIILINERVIIVIITTMIKIIVYCKMQIVGMTIIFLVLIT